jgi:hypothetical protein
LQSWNQRPSRGVEVKEWPIGHIEREVGQMGSGVRSGVAGGVLAVAGCALGATGCGLVPAQTAVGPPSPVVHVGVAHARTVSGQPSVPAQGSPPPTLAGPVTLTLADNGAVIRLRAGQRVAVALASEGFLSWHVPAAAGAAVRRVSVSGGYPGQQPARGAFLVVRSGRVILTSIDDTACLHTQPACEPAQQEWRVTVIVSGG